MITFYEWVWLLSLLVLTTYHLVIFRRRKYAPVMQPKELPGVSIVIAHKDHFQNLSQNLQAIISQDYPSFEIIIVDDHSAATEISKLKELISPMPLVKLLHSTDIGKKHALIMGINAAANRFIICTDADCKPVSSQWIRKMMELKKGNSVVLGYSPYQQYPGWLNLLIRFETIMTAIQYMSWAYAGRPYMGVGRNILFTRSVFLETDPFGKHLHIPYGDDDLLVQALATKVPVRICDDTDAHVITEPPLSWNAWWKQKHRHMSASHHYKHSHWLKPGLYGLAMIIHWIMLGIFIFILHWWNWVPVFCIGLVIRWLTYGAWANVLAGKDTFKWYPFLEIQYACYLGLMGVNTLFNKKKSWS